ncbi:MAG: large conductance mechanosensitive channel protein MscL [Clostridia bacterium]|nr:large conductance mechanosensitive channel protein MscL [Clostridia bacterium]
MGTFWSDFKKFISKGNVIDLSVGVVIGGAFGKITSSLVADIIMPLVGLAVGGLDVSQWKIVLKEAVLAADGVTVEAAEVAVRYGNFLQMILDFLIIAFSIFCVLRVVMHSKKKAEAQAAADAAEAKAKADAEAKEAAEKAAAEAAAAQKKIDDERAEELALLREIRDSLKK